MLCAIVLLSLATLALGLSPSALEISVKAAASTVASVDDIVIGVVVYNPTDKDIRVIARNNILDTSSTRSFTVKALDDELVFFMGVRALYDLSASDVYMTIPAGGYVAVNHTNVGALYLFEFYGTGTYTFEPIALFQGGPDTLLEVVDVPPFKVEITHDVKRRNPYPRYAGCSDASKNQVLLESFNSFRAIAQEVYSEFQSSPPEQMSTYFSGGGTITEYLSIDSILDYMAYYDYAILPIDCESDPAGICGSSDGIISYNMLGESSTFLTNGYMYICDTFFTSVGTIPGVCNGFGATTSSREGVFAHEFMNLLALIFYLSNMDMRDIAYGCPAVTSLSAEDQYNNPDNYRCLVMAIYCEYLSSHRRLDEL